MVQNRRRYDKCLMRRVYDLATPYVQLIGWAGVAIPVLYVAFAFVSTASAYGERISRIEEKQASLDEIRFNLKNLMNHAGVPYVERE